MTGTTCHNGRIPTDPTAALLVLLAVTLASQLTPDQADAIIATGGIAQLALTVLSYRRGGR